MGVLNLHNFDRLETSLTLAIGSVAAVCSFHAS